MLSGYYLGEKMRMLNKQESDEGPKVLDHARLADVPKYINHINIT